MVSFLTHDAEVHVLTRCHDDLPGKFRPEVGDRLQIEALAGRSRGPGDLGGELAEAVRAGRRKEFAEAYEQNSDNVPDPLAKQTVLRATLDWAATGPEA